MKTLVIVILVGFADWEASLLAPALRYFTDYSILYASTDKNEKVSFGALRAKPDLTIDEISPDAAAIVLIGARNSWRELPSENASKIANLIEEFKQQGKVVGGICDGAYFLAAAGALNDCHHTANSLADIVNLPKYKNKHAFIQTSREAVVDGKMITANGNAFIDFTIQMLRALGDIDEAIIAQCEQMWR